jgi:hypothetical protein
VHRSGSVDLNKQTPKEKLGDFTNTQNRLRPDLGVQRVCIQGVAGFANGTKHFGSTLMDDIVPAKTLSCTCPNCSFLSCHFSGGWSAVSDEGSIVVFEIEFRSVVIAVVADPRLIKAHM